MRPEQQLRGFLDRSSITTALKSRGFSKSGQTWTRSRGGVAHLLSFQRSRFCELGSVTFTVNVGVASEDIRRVYLGDSLGYAIHEADCFPSFRVGEVLGGFRGEATDIWWTLAADGGSEELAAEVKSAILESCVPILDRLDSSEAVFHFVQKEAPSRFASTPFARINLAIAHHLYGDVQRAKWLLDELEANPKIGVDWRTRIQDVRTRLRHARGSGG